MKTLIFKYLSFSILILLCVFESFTWGSSQPISPTSVASNYENLLGRLIQDKVVTEFVDNQHCKDSGSFRLCPSIGVAFWNDNWKVIKLIYLYVKGTGNFNSFKGRLPFGLTLEDTMGTVEEKLGQPVIPQAPYLGIEPGLPDRGGSPDHQCYWAMYDRYDLIIVYDSPNPTDKGAGIQIIILVYKPHIPEIVDEIC